jgi:hypothetical protein
VLISHKRSEKKAGAGPLLHREGGSLPEKILNLQLMIAVQILSHSLEETQARVSDNFTHPREEIEEFQ